MKDKVVAIMREEIDAEPLSMRVSPIAANQNIAHQVTMTRERNKKSCALYHCNLFGQSPILILEECSVEPLYMGKSRTTLLYMYVLYRAAMSITPYPHFMSQVPSP